MAKRWFSLGTTSSKPFTTGYLIGTMFSRSPKSCMKPERGRWQLSTIFPSPDMIKSLLQHLCLFCSPTDILTEQAIESHYNAIIAIDMAGYRDETVMILTSSFNAAIAVDVCLSPANCSVLLKNGKGRIRHGIPFPVPLKPGRVDQFLRQVT